MAIVFVEAVLCHDRQQHLDPSSWSHLHLSMTFWLGQLFTLSPL